MARINPYQRLLNEVREFCRKIKYPHKKLMWYYPKAKLNSSWSLGDLYERTKAADQIGYDVKLEAKDDGLRVLYVKKLPSIPYSWD